MHSNLAALATARGDFDGAIAHGKAALDCEPQFADAYLNLADAENARDRIDAALRWIDALLAFAPNHVAGLAARALLLLRGGRGAEALEAIQRAALLAPQDGGLQLRLGDVLQSLSQEDEAQAAWRRALQLPGRAAQEASARLATLPGESGVGDARQ